MFALLPNFLLPHPYDVEVRHAMIRRPDRCDEATDRCRRCKVQAVHMARRPYRTAIGQSAASGRDNEPEGRNRRARGNRGGLREPKRHWRCQRAPSGDAIGETERAASETRSQAVVGGNEAKGR